ncbi:cupin domain-containing protein [Actinocrispum wychmicini]|uniref:Mannose-6-phosphate isomerase-like protein (Cupin superfamily) n=1 Tax=Actinocrispum wychmicini TaxID=1213861 RepID=A0A4R2JIU5_9PSEU|nr:cupin domain-containing protein [Actinocrispum wychmicini]TCO59853.1 mannose-6-phosphate isomerase-like protein (cupin superfamily) [Actinocrispum wychmicini]
MRVINETEERTTTTPTGVMTALAGPSQGSDQVSTWRVRLAAEAESPVHLIDHDQVWMPISGTFSFTVGDETSTASAGQAVLLRANEVRQFRPVGGPAEALVCMAAAGRAGVPGTDGRQSLPWAL